LGKPAVTPAVPKTESKADVLPPAAVTTATPTRKEYQRGVRRPQRYYVKGLAGKDEATEAARRRELVKSYDEKRRQQLQEQRDADKLRLRQTKLAAQSTGDLTTGAVYVAIISAPLGVGHLPDRVTGLSSGGPARITSRNSKFRLLGLT